MRKDPGDVTRRTETRGGLTRLEVAVVLTATAAVAGLTAMALPGLRESARRSVCRAHLRQVGLALQSYEQAHGSLPPAAVWNSEGNVATLDMDPWTGGVTFQNWAVLLLPHLDRAAPAARSDASQPIVAAANKDLRTAELELWKCPSDPFNGRENRYVYRTPEGLEAEFARGNYGINGGPQLLARKPGAPSAPAADGFDYEVTPGGDGFRWSGSGVAGFNVCFRTDNFRNGLSSTVAVDELRAGVHPLDPRGVWAFGQIGGSVTWGHGITGDDVGPNNAGDRSDDVLGCGRLHKKLGGRRLAELGMPCCWYWDLNAQATARSLHEGGVHALMADGAVRFVADAVAPDLWHVTHSRETPADRLGADVFDAPEPAADPPAPPAAGVDPATAALPAAGTKIVNSVGMELVLLPSGSFTMGVPDLGHESQVPAEAPPHPVRLTRPFYMGVFEVTQEQYERVMGINPAHHTSGREFSGFPSQDTGRLPVEDVSWEDATEFCRRLSERPEESASGLTYRLPTEAEWEYACRAGLSRPYQSTRVQSETGVNVGNPAKSLLGVTAVGSYPANAFGLHDMRGNVYEWCADRFARDYYRRSPTDDPAGPPEGFFRVVRGADWLFAGEGCMINRRVAAPWQANRYLGFRVAAVIHPGHDAGGLSPDPSIGRYELAVTSSFRSPSGPELIRLDPFRRTARLVRGGWCTTPAFSPDGQTVAYVDGRDLFVIRQASDLPKNLSEGRLDAASFPAWLPDGDGILFVGKRGEENGIFVIGPGGGEPGLQLRASGNVRSPAVSRDGKRLLFLEGTNDAWPAMRLRVTDLAGGAVGPESRDLVDRPVPFDAGPAWSPEGRRIAFADWGATWERRRIVLRDVETGKDLPVTEADGYCVHPAWSPDGRFLAFVRYPGGVGNAQGRGDLCLLEVESGRPSVVAAGTMPLWEHARPAWNPVTGSGSLPDRELRRDDL